MKTRITELFNIEHPIICAGMSEVATPTLASAVSNAGGLGIINLTTVSVNDVAQIVGEIRAKTKKPFGVNMTQMLPNAANNIKQAIKAQVPIINTAFGKCDWYKDDVHAYGGKVVSTVNNLDHALAAEQQGADAIILTGFEAAAHSGNVGNMALIPAITDRLSIPVIAAGGIADGRGLLAAMSLGADAVSMGSRFLASQEAGVHVNCKEAVVKHGVMDTILSANFDGFPVRVINTVNARKLAKQKPNLFRMATNALRFSDSIDAEKPNLLAGFPKNIPMLFKLAHLGSGMQILTQAMRKGDLDKGLQTIGQSMGSINDIKPAADIVADIMYESQQVLNRVNSL